MGMGFRIGLALVLLLGVLWAVWGFKDRPLTARPVPDIKGVYQGPADQPASEAAREAARLRARHQAF
ncbi:hypothetical protein HRbin40_00551 [bacterium HR40]|nr:hypothetical protein HRbin40_00551 [bacterium HR40]